jgi:hypothetical protein
MVARRFSLLKSMRFNSLLHAEGCRHPRGVLTKGRHGLREAFCFSLTLLGGSTRFIMRGKSRRCRKVDFHSFLDARKKCDVRIAISQFTGDRVSLVILKAGWPRFETGRFFRNNFLTSEII